MNLSFAPIKITIKTVILILFFCFTIPVALKPPTMGRSADRCGQTAGVVRMYCQDSSLFFTKSPQVHFGNRPFNLEFTAIEWIQGRLLHHFGDTNCEGVEKLTKISSVLFSGLALLGVGLLAQFLFGQVASHLSMTLLATNELWLRYSSYSMIENRALCFAVFAIYTSLRRKNVLSFIFWSLTFLQKPQVFVFASAFWIGTEIFRLLRIEKELSFMLFVKSLKKPILFYIGSIGVGLLFLAWSMKVNKESDLPWITWMGPRHLKWFLGDFGDRFSFEFIKGLFFHWYHRCGIAYFLVFVFVGFVFNRKRWNKKIIQESLLASLPFLLSTFSLTFIFYPAFKAHEYYALPLDVASAVCMAGVISVSSRNLKSNSFRILLAIGFIVPLMNKGLTKYSEFYSQLKNKDSAIYSPNWNRKIFPNSTSTPPGLVVIAAPESQRDTLYLYQAKRNGFQWCTNNKEFAPRKFWKESGVEYVAWAKSVDSKSGLVDWEVLHIDEELKRARENNWSSDIHDIWNGKTMSEWASLASIKDLDPCRSAEMADPRTW